MTSLETRLKSESSQDMYQDSTFSLKEGTWTPKIRTGDREGIGIDSEILKSRPWRYIYSCSDVDAW